MNNRSYYGNYCVWYTGHPDHADSYCVSEGGIWRPGVFDTEEAALLAATKLNDEQIQLLQDIANKNRNYNQRVITLDIVRMEIKSNDE